jgi:hypothetical protein
VEHDVRTVAGDRGGQSLMIANVAVDVRDLVGEAAGDVVVAPR